MNSRTSIFKRIRVLGVAIFFGLSIALLLVIALSSTRSRETLNSALHAIETNQQIRNLVLLVSQHTIAAETGERGYLITGEEVYLESYEGALADRSSRIASLEELAREIPEFLMLVPELKTLIASRDRELETAIALRRAGNFDETVEAVRAGLRKNLSEQIRGVLQQMETIVTERLRLTQTDYRHRIKQVTWIMTASAYLSLALGVLGLAFLTGHLRDQIRTMRLERDREEAVRLAKEKSRFLASMNHEIRTPLNALLGFCELLENEVHSSRGLRYLSAIRTSGTSLADLINDILDLSRIESGMLDLSPGPVNVREFATSLHMLFEEQARSAGLIFEFTVDEDCPDVLVFDPLRVRQILVNLFSNAIKFTSRGSIRGFIWATSFREGKCDLAFSVQDTGRGIASDKMELVFQPFRQAEVSDETLGGTGLGLSICHELAALMGGEIEVSSEVGVGTEFLLILKQVEIVDLPGALPKDETAIQTDFNELPPSRVLVADDNQFNIELISGYFEGSHHHLEFAGNGLEALQLMQQNPPDIVLMDIRMPVMSGDEAYLHMKEDERLESIPVIAVTASTLSNQEHRLRELFDGYLRKPFTRAGLFNGMKTVLSRRDRTDREELSAKGVPEVPSLELMDPETAPMPPSRDARQRESMIEELKELRSERWGLLLRAMLMSDVASVADELSEIAKRYDEPELSTYADELRQAVEQINQPLIEDLLKRFNALIEKLS